MTATIIGVDEATLSTETQEAHDEATHQRSQEADDDVHERALTRAALNFPSDPPRDETDDDPPDDAHDYGLPAEIFDMRSAKAPAPMVLTSVGCCA